MTSTPAPVATETATASGTLTPSPTPAATTAPAALAFSLDAARVARVNNPGNFSGLSAVKRGTRVWLMMYYTVSNISHSSNRLTTYRVGYRGKTVFNIAYKTKIKTSERGRFSRYQVFDVPSTLPYGHYTFHATLSIGNRSQSKGWHFTVATKEVVAKTTGRS
jgi:hypothetical protein